MSTAAESVPEWTLADRLRKALRWSGVSTYEMAEYLGIARETVSRYANHEDVRVPLQTQRLWALRTGVPLEWLQSGKIPSRLLDGDGGRAGGKSANSGSLDYKVSGTKRAKRTRSASSAPVSNGYVA